LKEKAEKILESFFFEKNGGRSFRQLVILSSAFLLSLYGKPFYLSLCHFIKPLACNKKLFTVVIVAERGFATSINFHPSLIFEGQVRAYQSGAPYGTKL
jgi:hypothetical protein